MADEREEINIYDGYAELVGRDLESLLDEDLEPEVEEKLRKRIDKYVEMNTKDQKDFNEANLKRDEFEQRKLKDQTDAELKKKELELKERELDLKESSQTLEWWKVGLGIASAVIGVGELLYVIHSSKDFMVSDYMLQEEGFMPGNLGKTGRMLLDTELRNNIPK